MCLFVHLFLSLLTQKDKGGRRPDLLATMEEFLRIRQIWEDGNDLSTMLGNVLWKQGMVLCGYLPMF